MKKYMFYIIIGVIGFMYGYLIFIFYKKMLYLSLNAELRDFFNNGFGAWIILYGPVILFFIMLIAFSVIGKHLYENWGRWDIALANIIGVVSIFMPYFIAYLRTKYWM